MPTGDPTVFPKDAVRTLLSIAATMPRPAFMSEEQAIDLEDMADEMVQAIADSGNAGVAQSEERLPRKQEAVGSIPAASSKGLTERQRDKMRTAVHRRVQLEDARKDSNNATRELEQLEKDYVSKKKELQGRIADKNMAIKHYTELLIEAEDEFRKDIINDLLLRAKDEIESTISPVEVAPVEEHEDLGRAE